MWVTFSGFWLRHCWYIIKIIFISIFTVGVDEFLKIRFMRLSKVKLKTLDVDSVDMHFQSFYANLYHGTINIDPSNNTICENIALIFTISVLHVLCAPENPGRRMKLSFGKLSYHNHHILMA